MNLNAIQKGLAGKTPEISLLSQLTKNQVQAGEPMNQLGSLQISLKNENSPALPAAIILVLDCSGSMAGEPMALLDQAIDKICQNLREEDILSIVAFGSDSVVLVKEQNKQQLFQGIPALYDLGSTNYYSAFETALNALKQSDITQKLIGKHIHSVAKTILFMSDGKPNQGGPYLDLVKEFGKIGYSLHALGIGKDVEPDELMKIAEYAGGTYEHADNEQELEQSLLNLLDLSQNLVYSLPKLEISILPNCSVKNIKIVAPPREIETDLIPGDYEYLMPDIQRGATIELVFEISVDNSGKSGETQELIEWNMVNAQTEVTKIMWVDMNTAILASASTKPAIFTKIYEGFKAIKDGNTKTAKEISKLLGKMPNNQMAQTGATILTEVADSKLTHGKILAMLSKTTTNFKGSIKKSDK